MEYKQCNELYLRSLLLKNIIHNQYTETSCLMVHIPCAYMKDQWNHAAVTGHHVFNGVWVPAAAIDLYQYVLLLSSTHSCLWQKMS